MFVWGVMLADRALDIIGLATLCYFIWRLAAWWSRPKLYDPMKGKKADV